MSVTNDTSKLLKTDTGYMVVINGITSYYLKLDDNNEWEVWKVTDLVNGKFIRIFENPKSQTGFENEKIAYEFVISREANFNSESHKQTQTIPLPF